VSDLPREVLLYVLRKHSDPEIAAGFIEEYSLRRKRAVQRMVDIEAVKKKAAKDIQKLCDEVICKHEITKNHGDPSGGSDGYHECLICGEEVREKSVRFT
jgi:hypothetical protein